MAESRVTVCAVSVVPFGVGYGLDPNGFIISDVSIDNIDNVYVPCIRESVESLRNSFQHQLHSVYLYGSVARGEAVVLKSDLDLIAMFDGKMSSFKLADIKKIAGELDYERNSNETNWLCTQ